MNDIVRRLTVVDIYNVKTEVLRRIGVIDEEELAIRQALEDIHGYFPGRIEWQFDNYDANRQIKWIDKYCWGYLVKHFQLQKYMLCTEFEKMQKDIQESRTPEFTPTNATAWIDGLKSLIHENVRTMLKSVYDKIINSTYYTGSGYSSLKQKKRNNNGIDGWFIIHTGDYYTMGD